MTEEIIMDESESKIEDLELELEETLDDTEEVAKVNDEVEKVRTFAKQAIARAKKAEAELKELKTPKEEAKAPQNINSTQNEELIERKILKSQGLSDELLDELTALSKVRGTSLLDTQNDPIYLALKQSKEDGEKAKKAKLPASKGSGTVKVEKTFNTPGLTDEEHKALWRETQG